MSIQIKTLLGEKYLAIDAEGPAQQDPHQPIPRSRTISPFDITDAVNQLANTVDNIDTGRLAQSFEVIAQTFKNSSQGMKSTLAGLEALSRTISSRDAELSRLLANTNVVSATLASRDAQFQQLLSDGNLLLETLQAKRDAVSGLLTGTQQLSTQLEGLVNDNQAKLTPALADLKVVMDILAQNQADLNRGLADLAPFVRLFTNTVGNGRWFDGYFCGLLPPPVITQVFQSNPQGCSPPIAAPNLTGVAGCPRRPGRAGTWPGSSRSRACWPCCWSVRCGGSCTTRAVRRSPRTSAGPSVCTRGRTCGCSGSRSAPWTASRRRGASCGST